MTGTETKWSERVREWEATGGTAAAFAEGRGFEASTLRYWASRLRHPEKYPVGAKPPRPVRMVRVTPVVKVRDESLVIVVGAARVVVRAGFDGALLRDVVNALGGAT